MIHSSNNVFTDNIVDVTSQLESGYDLNESANAIAGVFVHYGGFNNEISSNLINVESNDPILYGIGIVGAPLNSTAAGSLNNDFSDNEVYISGPYNTVCILLGNKAVDSNIVFNYFNITSGKTSHNIVRYNSSAPNTVENNTFENNYLATTLTLDNASYIVTNANKVLIATLLNENGFAVADKTIVFSVNNVNYTGTTDSNGVATVIISLNKAGTYDVYAGFAGDNPYLQSEASAKLTLKKESTSITASGKTYVVTATTKSVSLTLKDSSGKAIANRNVTATVNGKTYRATTNSKGVATFKLSLTAVKSYSVALKFAGDSTYSASSKKVTVKVTKSKTTLTVPVKTYKKTAKTKKLTATLKAANGKVLKSKKLKFTVNGKTYTATTNSKGVATVNVKLTAKKTYKVTVKFAGDSSYYAVTKTSKVVIK